MQPNTLYNLAHEAGMEALENATPREMVVTDSNGKVYRCAGGVCGFADVRIKPARGKFVSFLKKNDIGYTSYLGGYTIPCHEGDQSLELKEAYVRAFAKVLKDSGITAYTTSNMD